MTNAPVSVVVPCYRCTLTIERAVASVVAQTLRPAEMILVDDASSDSTLQVLRALQVRYGHWIRIVGLVSNCGAASARNAGWNVATQPYIAFLDSDDTWHPRKIEIQYKYMQQHTDVALSGHLCRQLPHGTRSAPQWRVENVAVQTVTWNALLLRHQFVTPSVMLKREIAQRFTEGARHMEDHRLWLEIVGAPLCIVKLQAELAAVYKPVYGASGLSANMWGMEKAELANYRYFQSVKKINTFQMILLQGYSLVKYVRRILIVRVLRRA
jgi:glycosyltransferase involved in cell wall biosynthesis